MFVAMFVSFMGVALLLTHLKPTTMRKLVGYKGFVDVFLHGAILYLFMGTSTMGLLQAEAAGICFSLYLRAYAYAFGYERLHDFKWRRHAGRFT